MSSRDWLMRYAYPTHYPKNCPPENCGEARGKYYRVVANLDKADSQHYKSYYDLKKGKNYNTCKARALSMVLTRQQAYGIIATLGQAMLRFIALFDLRGGHGQVQIDNPNKGHCSWWVPSGVNPSDYCVEIEEA